MSRSFHLSLAVLLAALLGGCGDDSTPVRPDAATHLDAPATSPDAPVSCVDDDGDGYGEGCAAGADCDDTDSTVNPAADELCNGVDDDCDDEIDEAADLTPPQCAEQRGVCAGSRKACGGVDGWLACAGTASFGADYEETETSCDGLDNDCDGQNDEPDDMTPPSCDEQRGVCLGSTKACGGVDGWLACDASRYGADYEAAETRCDGLDNDCDDQTDELADMTPPLCQEQRGVCSGSTKTCGGVDGWLACAGTASYGADYEETETSCDEKNNDCDASTDEGCPCTPLDGVEACGVTDLSICQLGTRTCTATGWSDCSGNIDPISPELCNGIDDDCDETPDNHLEPAPLCAEQRGVCSGSTQACGGVDGWLACDASRYGADYEAVETRCDGKNNDCDDQIDEPDDMTPPPCAEQRGVCAGSVKTCSKTASGWSTCGPANYGADYVANEDGAANENICDGLDNDCDGQTDEGCTTRPLVQADGYDLVSPALYNQYVAFLGNLSGNRDVFLYDFRTGSIYQLTDTPEDEGPPDIYGDHVVYTRGTGNASRVYHLDLATGVETMISPTGSMATKPRIGGSFVVWEDWRQDTNADVYLYSLADDAEYAMANTAVDEMDPDLRWADLVYAAKSGAGGVSQIHTVDLTTGDDVVPTSNTKNRFTPRAGLNRYVWSDGRNAGAPWDETVNWDAWAAAFAAAPAEVAVSSAAGAQMPTDIDDVWVVMNDRRSGSNWDVTLAGWDGAAWVEQTLTTGTADQLNATVNGAWVVWQDARGGDFDLYFAYLGGWAAGLQGAGALDVVEVLTSPDGVDVNGDGTASAAQDSFVELRNWYNVAWDIGGCELRDSSTVRHVFPDYTVVPPTGGVVVFGGGTPALTFGGSEVFAASSGSLGLDAASDSVTLTCPDDTGNQVTIATMSWSSATVGESIVYDTDAWVGHTTVNPAMSWSPGTDEWGFGL